MLSRALSSATVMLLIGCFAVIPVQAQNLEAGKSPSQIFAGTCTACHKSPRGLLKTVPAGSLPGFLRQHYTTSGEMASLLSGFLVSNGAADTRYVGTQPRQGKDAKSEERSAGPPDQLDRFGRRLRPAAGPSQEAARPGAEPQQAARPDADGLPQAEPGRQGRNARRLARPGEAPDAAKPVTEGQVPAQAASERGPDGRKSVAKHRLSKRGKPGGEEPPKADAPKNDTAKVDAKTDAAKDEPSKGEPAKDDTPKSETAKGEDSKPEEHQARGHQTREHQAVWRGQVRGRQGRRAEGDRQRRARGAADRSGSPGHPCAVGFPGGVRGGFQRHAGTCPCAFRTRCAACAPGGYGLSAAATAAGCPRGTARAADLAIGL